MPWRAGTPIRTESSGKVVEPKMEKPKKRRKRSHPLKLMLLEVNFSVI
jgi:hypothetical protein